MLVVLFFLFALTGVLVFSFAGLGGIDDKPSRQYRYKPKTALDDITCQFKRSSKKLKKDLKRQYYYRSKRRK